MATPVAHSLVAISACWAFAEGRTQARTRMLASCILFANLPDVDYLPGLWTGDINAFHQSSTHSLAFAGLAFMLGALLAPYIAMRPGKAALLLGILSLSHLAVDMLTADFKAPVGIPLLWPISMRSFSSPVSLFLPPDKSSLAELGSPWNLLVVVAEIGVMAPFLFLARRRSEARKKDSLAAQGEAAT